MNLSERLNCYIDVYGKMEIRNELGELDFKYSKISSLWAEITPQGGSNRNSQADTIWAEISHKFTIRSGVIKKELTNDMYFMFQGQRYDIKYFIPNYKYRDCIEVFCSLEVGK